MEKLGKYEVRSVLGRGAMGTVYEGWDPIISRRVAIKTVRLPDSDDSEEREQLERFKQEAQAAGRLNHPNIVGVFDYGETAEVAFIVMEFVDGKTWKSILDAGTAAGTRTSLAEVGRLMDGLLSGLAFSHGHGVIHRDIKPANVIVTNGGQVKIADFGIARIESSTMTQAGSIMGTPAYMSPEQFQGISIDSRTDIYSAGIVLYQLLTGKRPFEGSMATIMHAVLNSETPRPSALEPDVPAALDMVVARAIARSPDDRFEDAAAFNRALQAALQTPGQASAGASGSPLGLPDGLGDLLGDDPTVVRPASRPGTSPGGPAARGAPIAGTTAAGPAAKRVATTAAQPAARTSALPLILAGVAALAVLGGGGAFWALSSGGTKPATVATNETAPHTPPPMRPVESPTPPPTQPQPPVTPPSPQTVPSQTVSPPTVSPPTVSSQPSQPQPATVLPTPGPAQPTPNQPDPGLASPNLPTPATPTTPLVSPFPSIPAQPPTVPAQPAAEPPQPAASAPTIESAAPRPMTTEIRRALGNAIRSASCTFATADDDLQGPVLRGVAGQASGEAGLRAAAQAAAPGATIGWQVQDVDDRYCGLLDLLRPFGRAYGSNGRMLTLGLPDGRMELAGGELVRPRLAFPEGSNQLQLDYIANDGSVLHMHDSKPGLPYGSESTAAFGDPRPGFKGWSVDEPYGTDVVIAISTPSPLFRAGQPLPDTLDAYLPELRAALAQAGRNGGRVNVAVLPIRTRKAP